MRDSDRVGIISPREMVNPNVSLGFAYLYFGQVSTFDKGVETIRLGTDGYRSFYHFVVAPFAEGSRVDNTLELT